MKILHRSPEPFFYSGGKTGILLVHGFLGTPSEMRPMGQYFIDQGYTVSAPLLAGHGKTAADMVKTDWPDWFQSVVTAYERLRTENLERIFVAGLSMGGALSLLLAAQKPIDGVISMCAPIWIKDRRHALVELVHHFYPYYTPKNRKKRHPDVESMIVQLDKTPLKSVACLKKMIRTQICPNLKKITVPALIVQSRHDETINSKSAQYIYQHISSKNKSLSWYEKSCHIITLDKERGKLFKEVEEFITTTTKQ